MTGSTHPALGTLPTLETSHLRIRPLGPDDVPALFAIFGDADVCRYWSRPPLADLAAAAALHEEIAQHFAARTLFQWGIAERATDAIVGTCTLAALSWEHRRADVGYALARAVWGRGYLKEALPVLLDHAFGALALHRIEADVDPRNTASIRLLERMGFRREGYLRERYLQAGEIQDAVIFGLLEDEWHGRRSGAPGAEPTGTN